MALLVAAARELAKQLLEEDLPERWLHSEGVARRAAELAATVGDHERSVLIASAWLHDIGYSSLVRDTGFHPLDGGQYLRAAGWDERIAALVAHHSGARFVPASGGFGPLMAQFPFEESDVSDALTYADQTVGLFGKRMTLQEHIAADAIEGDGPVSPMAQARIDRLPYVLAVADRVEKRLAAQRA